MPSFIAQTESFLARIARDDAHLRAWAYVDAEGAMAAAEMLDAELAAGRSQRPLHGLVIGVKDIIDVAGMPTRAGSGLTSPTPRECDAPAVARLRAAGVIILGKTVTCQFAGFDPAPTRNPWHDDHTPGGSSSGSAAAVAAGMCAAALGSQTGGSITRPASYCGLASCKPTYGLVSTQGVVPFSHRLDHLGPIARRVDDLARLLSGLADAPAEPFYPLTPRAAPPRLGLLEPYFLETASDEVRETMHAALEKLQAAGARVQRVTLPESFGEVHAMHRRIMVYDAAEYHRDQFAEHAEDYGPQMAALLREGQALSVAEYEAALGHQQQFRTEISAPLAELDALVTPATLDTAPHRATTGDSRFNAPWSYSGLPTVSLPIALASNGMPVALQLIGRHYADASLLATAAWCEAQFNFAALPPGV